jgi:alanine dehydrogenase
MTKMLSLSRDDLEPLIGMKEALGFAEKAYRLQWSIRGGSVSSSFSPLVAYGVVAPSGSQGFVDYRSGWIREIPVLLSVMGFGYPENKSKHNLPGVFALALLSDPETGAPLAIMEADHLASMRTGAAGAIASKYLGRRESHSISFIGAGHLARNMLLAHIEQGFEIKSARVWSRSQTSSQSFSNEISKKYGFKVEHVDTPGKAVEGADIICCCSQSTEPRVMLQDLKEGVHINAFGTDSPGKQELDQEILQKSKIVVDSLEQCSLGGEIHKALRSGLISEKDIYAEIGQIVCGEKPGRDNDQEMTVMDATGLAVQDLIIFYEAYSRSLSKGVGTWIKI